MYRGVSEESPRVITVASQNVLLDYTRTKNGLMLSQDMRIQAVADSLRTLEELDVVGIQEAHKSRAQHNGEVLADSLGFGPGFWVQHNQKPYPGSSTGRDGECMGLFGNAVDTIETIDIGDNRLALMTVIGGVAFVALHLRSGVNARRKRARQAKTVEHAVDDYENAVLMGDFNEPFIRYISKGRRRLERHGFQSVFTQTGQNRPNTWPTDAYADVMLPGNDWQQRLGKYGWSFDDILTRGPKIKVLAAGVLQHANVADEILNEFYEDNPSALDVPTKPSDHEGVWARLSIVPLHD